MRCGRVNIENSWASLVSTSPPLVGPVASLEQESLANAHILLQEFSAAEFTLCSSHAEPTSPSNSDFVYKR